MRKISPTGIETKEKDDSICWYCIHAVPNERMHRGCEWSVKKQPVPGWRAEETHIKYGSCAGFKSFNVTGCPKFRADADDPRTDDMMSSKADLEELIKAIIFQALRDWDDYFDEMNRLIKAKNIQSAIEIGKAMNIIDEWFRSGCDGFISRGTARKIIQGLHSPTESEDIVCDDDFKQMLSKDIDAKMSHYITKTESKLAVMSAYRKAEYEMAKAFKGDKKLCTICRKNSIKKCGECAFEWKGKPLA